VHEARQEGIHQYVISRAAAGTSHAAHISIEISQAVGVGFIVMGVIGYVVKLVVRKARIQVWAVN
jgi:hypothetical protein